MITPPGLHHRVLIAIPTYNEAETAEAVIEAVRAVAPQFDLLVVNDGSRDATGEILARTGVLVATHLCNLGYGRALQTALRYGQRAGYDAVITFDADGQHRAEDLAELYDTFVRGSFDLLIGSRFVSRRDYSDAPFARRIGMRFFSLMIRGLTGLRIYDPSSGLKVIRRSVFDVLLTRPAVDFHAESIVYLVRAGFSRRGTSCRGERASAR